MEPGAYLREFPGVQKLPLKFILHGGITAVTSDYLSLATQTFSKNGKRKEQYS